MRADRPTATDRLTGCLGLWPVFFLSAAPPSLVALGPWWIGRAFPGGRALWGCAWASVARPALPGFPGSGTMLSLCVLCGRPCWPPPAFPGGWTLLSFWVLCGRPCWPGGPVVLLLGPGGPARPSTCVLFFRGVFEHSA